jgi:nucleoside-diphosphate-sugar epimerase
MSTNRVCLLGGGFIGRPLAIAFQNSGYDVTVVLKSHLRHNDFSKLGIKTIISEVGKSSPITDFGKFDILVVAYPIGRLASRQELMDQINWIGLGFPKDCIHRVFLTSSISVYPDGLGCVDELCTIRPEGYGAAQLGYEEALSQIYGAKLTIFRLAGLVGSDERLPGSFLAGKQHVPNALSPVNMVHQQDVVRFIMAAVIQRIQNEVINICYPSHPTRFDYYTLAAKALGYVPPTFSSEQIKKPRVISSNKSIEILGLSYEFMI